MLNPFTHRKILKKGLPGRATIVERGALDRGGTSFNLPMTLQVHVEGITPYEVEDQWMVKAKDAIGLQGSVPVKVDPDDHSRVAIDWEEVRAAYEQHKADRQATLAQGGIPGATVTINEGEAIDLSSSPELAGQISQALGQAGIDLGQMGGAGGSGSIPAQGNAADDTVAQLERLAALRDSGALTEAEFQQQKARILGGD